MKSSAIFAEQGIREDLAHLLRAAVEDCGHPRGQIAADAAINRDSLRRILAGTRSATLGEAMRILAACGTRPQALLLLYLSCGSKQAANWLNAEIAQFIADFSAEFPVALERVLGNQIGDVKPRWAKGTAHRVARLLSDHIVELERREAALGWPVAGQGSTTHD